MGFERDRAALVETDHRRVERAGLGRFVQAQDPLLLELVERVVGPFPGPDPLRGDPHGVEQSAQVRFGDRREHPAAEQVTPQTGERPTLVGLTEITGTGEGHRTDRVAIRVSDPPRAPAPGTRAERVHPVRVELADHPAHLVLVGLEHLGDLGGRDSRVRRQQDLGPLT